MEEIIQELSTALEDVLEWLETGMVDGVGYCEQQVKESIQAALAKRKAIG